MVEWKRKEALIKLLHAAHDKVGSWSRVALLIVLDDFVALSFEF